MFISRVSRSAGVLPATVADFIVELNNCDAPQPLAIRADSADNALAEAEAAAAGVAREAFSGLVQMPSILDYL